LIASLIRGRAGDDPALEVALAQALLYRVSRGERPPLLRCYQPLPTVAFGRRDALAPGFAAAAAAAREHGFEPVLRAPGGRAAAYCQACLVLDEIIPARDPFGGMRERFAAEASRQAQALRGLAVDARVGEVAGEYCPGPFTVNARGVVKLIGSAQRVVRGGWLFSTVVVVDGASRLRAALTDVYAALGLAWDPATVGAIADEVPAESGVDVDVVQRELLRSYEPRYELIETGLEPDAIAAARALLDRHRVARP
jgi:lipoate-protein ligase A